MYPLRVRQDDSGRRRDGQHRMRLGLGTKADERMTSSRRRPRGNRRDARRPRSCPALRARSAPLRALKCTHNDTPRFPCTCLLSQLGRLDRDFALSGRGGTGPPAHWHAPLWPACSVAWPLDGQHAAWPGRLTASMLPSRAHGLVAWGLSLTHTHTHTPHVFGRSLTLALPNGVDEALWLLLGT